MMAKKKVILGGYGGTFHFPKGGGTVTKVNWDDKTNKKTSKKEVEWFLKAKPMKASAYLSSDGSEIQTWTGDKLGKVITRYSTKRRGWAGEDVYSVQARGINDMLYSGYGSKGNMINLKSKVKSKLKGKKK